MEKRTAHHDLAAIKAAVAYMGRAAFTVTAQMGLSLDEAILVVVALNRQAFTKA